MFFVTSKHHALSVLVCDCLHKLNKCISNSPIIKFSLANLHLVLFLLHKIFFIVDIKIIVLAYTILKSFH